jgi:aromatic ring hydroxylase
MQMFEQAILEIVDEKTFAEVLKAVDASFAPKQVEKFLQGVQKHKLRVRQFEQVLAAGLLGTQTPTQYAALGNSDRGQIREQYLRRVEKVDPTLRAKFLRLYAYY